MMMVKEEEDCQVWLKALGKKQVSLNEAFMVKKKQNKKQTEFKK